MHSWSLSLNTVARFRFRPLKTTCWEYLLTVQKRYSGLMLGARLLDNSVQLFQKLQWLLSDRIIRVKTLCMMFKTLNKECVNYSTNYITHVKYYHSYSTQSFNNIFVVPKCRSNASLRTFHASATCPWNCLDHNVMSMKYVRNLTKHIFLKINLNREHFVFVTRTS